MKNKLLFYSSVTDIKYFYTQKYYYTDINILKELGFIVSATNRISSFFQFWKYDVCFFYFYRWSFFPALLSRILGKKIYFTGGIDDLSLEKRQKKYIIQYIFFKLCYIVSNKCILVSSADLKNVKKLYHGKNLKKIELSYHAIDVSNYFISNEALKKNIFSTVAWMASIENVKRKGIDTSLYVFAELLKLDTYKNYLFYIVGTLGAGSDYLLHICKEINILDKVIFVGSISEEEKIKLLKESRFYFQLSQYEGFGIAAIEALAAKNIVIHSGNGGLADGIGTDGIMANIKLDVRDIANHIQNKIPQITIKQLENAQKRLFDKFNNERRLCDFKRILNVADSGVCNV